jgi:hypothetical protein
MVESRENYTKTWNRRLVQVGFFGFKGPWKCQCFQTNFFSKKPQDCGMCKFIRSHTRTLIFNLALVWRLIFWPIFIVEGIENMWLLWNTFSLYFGGPSFEGILKCEWSWRVQYTQWPRVIKWVKYRFTYANQSLAFTLNLNPVTSHFVLNLSWVMWIVEASDDSLGF